MGPFLRLEVILPAIVPAEEEDRVLVELEFLEEGDQLADVPIHHVHEGGIDPGIAIGSLACRNRYASSVAGMSNIHGAPSICPTPTFTSAPSEV